MGEKDFFGSILGKDNIKDILNLKMSLLEYFRMNPLTVSTRKLAEFHY